ncbi:hypothetical protein ABEB36_015090 [Hypothenemus hampei]|uniref:Uncharacterized protein n=1 Tax=Hypothenemus hampei TaxID=57062 RepID=A0ABD1E2G2_HYPHA
MNPSNASTSSRSSLAARPSTTKTTTIKRNGGNVNVNAAIEKSSHMINSLHQLLRVENAACGSELQKSWLKKLDNEILSCTRAISQRFSLSVGNKHKLQTNLELLYSIIIKE